MQERQATADKRAGRKSSLTPEQKKQIRNLRAEHGMTLDALAKRFSVNRSTIQTAISEKPGPRNRRMEGLTRL